MIARQASRAVAVVLLLLQAAGVCAHAEQVEVLGDLTCSLVGEVKAPPSADAQDTPQKTPGPSQSMICSFLPAGSGAEEIYSGTLFVPGALNERKALVWVVKGPRGAGLAPGSLAQTYTARTALADGGAGPLVGELGDRISLHLLKGRAASSAPAAVELKLKSTLG